MALICFTGFEFGSATFNIGDALSAGAGATISTTTVRTGTYAGRITPVTTEACYFQSYLYAFAGLGNGTGFNHATIYSQFYFRYAVKPTTNPVCIHSVYNTSSDLKFKVKLDKNGKLSVFDKNGTIIGSPGATVLSVNTWYRIDTKVTTGTPTSAYELKINGTSELSGNADLTNVNCGSIFFGDVIGSNPAENVDFFYDDIVIDDAAYQTGDVEVKSILPITNGSTMSWANGTGASDYTQVNELPPAVAEYVQSPTTGNPNIALFDMQSCATKSITGTIKALEVVTLTRENTSVTSATFLRIKSGASATDTATFNGTTTASSRGLLTLVDPATATAWTTGGIDAMEMGNVENNAVAVRGCSVVGMVAYVPATSNIKTYNTNVRANIKSINTNLIANVKTVNTIT